MMENNYFLVKKYIYIYIYQNTEQKEGCSCNLYIIVRNEDFQFI